MRVHVLRLHAGYRCRHAGVCCTEDWAIPVDAPLYRRLSGALDAATLQPEHQTTTYFEPKHGLEDDAPVVMGRVGCDCAFFEPQGGRLCAIHRQLGHRSLPSACQHFPRVVTIDPRGVFVSLSHVCPTAARLLCEPGADHFEVVHEGPVVTPGLQWAGLDAREALPPQVGPDVLWDWEALTVWEAGVLRLLDQQSPERAVSSVTMAARQLERWRPGGGGTLALAAASTLEAASVTLPVRGVDIDLLDSLAREAAPHPMPVPMAPAERLAADRHLVAPAWDQQRAIVARYLAARTVANAVGYHAASASVWAASLATAYAVLRAEVARRASQANRVLDADLLLAAAADADRLLVHRLDAGRLAASLLAALPF